MVVVFELRSADVDYARMQWDAGARGAWRAAWPYRKATNQGVAAAMFVQSVCRALGCFGVQQSWVYSVMWYAPGIFWALGPSHGGLPDPRIGRVGVNAGVSRVGDRESVELDLVHASTLFLGADNGILGAFVLLFGRYVQAVLGLQGHIGAVVAAWIIGTMMWHRKGGDGEYISYDYSDAKWTLERLRAAAGAYTRPLFNST